MGDARVLNISYVANQDVNSGLKGFHVVKILLSGEREVKSIRDFPDRESAYLATAILTLTDAAVGIVDEVGAGKIQEPLDEGVVREES